MNDKTYLSHYGILGMKWGHRKATGITSKQNPKPRFDLHSTKRRVVEPSISTRTDSSSIGKKMVLSMFAGALAGATTIVALSGTKGFKTGKDAVTKILSGAMVGVSVSSISNHMQAVSNTGIFKSKH